MGKLASISYERSATENEGERLPAISRQIYPDPEKGDAPLTFLDVVLDSTLMPLAENMAFTFTDMAGNSSTLSDWHFIIDQEMDLPVVQISLPLEDDVFVSDFIVSGVCFDDDEVEQIYWSIDGGEEQILKTRHGYSS
jgi:hypothetical protein